MLLSDVSIRRPVFATVMNILVAHQNMDDKTAYNIVKTIFEKKDDLVAVHPAANELDQETAGDVEFMDVCPGAQAFYGS